MRDYMPYDLLAPSGDQLRMFWMKTHNTTVDPLSGAEPDIEPPVDSQSDSQSDSDTEASIETRLSPSHVVFPIPNARVDSTATITVFRAAMPNEEDPDTLGRMIRMEQRMHGVEIPFLEAEDRAIASRAYD
jgi:hypothetical protein